MSSDEPAKQSILVVDDDPTLRDAIVFDFKRRGYRVFSAEDGVEAFEIVQKERIDAVITDIRMPRRNGIELLDCVKGYDIKIPVVIFITGFADLTLEDAYDKGACVVMSKPFDRKALVAAVQRAMQAYAEKLAIPAAPTDRDLRVELALPDSPEAASARILRIGQGGMFLAIEDRRPEVGQNVRFKIEQAQGTPALLQGQGVVRWVRTRSPKGLQDGFGVEFVFIDENCRENVIEFLENLKAKAFIPKAS